MVFRAECGVAYSSKILVYNQKTTQHNVVSIFSSEDGGSLFL
jgi:hypothetical protein